ncbi:MAG: pimeloyl-ACP methyl ester carboxylesterase [Myxococcota bacterium]|jgi:pimeloyl-ACP methyl ester carboxylesterase
MTPAEPAPLRSGDTGEVLHFAHANGLPAACYAPLLDRLAERHRVVAIANRSAWDPEVPADLDGWRPFAADLLAGLDTHEGPEARLVGVGHSLGAVTTLFAALQQPERFRALVLIEPVFLSPTLLAFLRLAPRWLRRRSAIAKRAARRRETWETLDAAFDFFRSKALFWRFDDQTLRSCVEAIVRPDDAVGYRLVIDRRWESAIFASPPQVWRSVAQNRIRTLAIRGEDSKTLTPEAWDRWKSASGPGDIFAEIPKTGHLAPLEAPEQVADLIAGFLA